MTSAFSVAPDRPQTGPPGRVAATDPGGTSSAPVIPSVPALPSAAVIPSIPAIASTPAASADGGGHRPPAVARDRDELRALLAGLDVPRAAGRPAPGEPSLDGPPEGHRPTRAVVMTMGALHEGHAALLRAARAQADHVVATIFVNPLQFGAGEDLDRYPRTFTADLELCARERVDVVFAPQVIHDPPPLVRLSAGPLGDLLEGASRPGHFDGMLTLVATMLQLVRPDLAFFGRKDAQQLACIRRMVADLAFDVTVIGVETARDTDGLALSSRNAYLTTPQRASALALSRALAAGVSAVDDGAAAVLGAAGAVLVAEDGVEVDYLALASPDDLRPVRSGAALLLVAARVGTTRLIDNIELVLPAEPGRPTPAPASGGVPRPGHAADHDHLGV